MEQELGKIIKISGPLVVAKDIKDPKLFDVVKVSRENLTGEIIEIRENLCWIQVYEETSGIQVGDIVKNTYMPLSVELGPGLLESFYDGIQRPLETIAKESGIFIGRGIETPSIDQKKKWEFSAKVKKGDKVSEGDILGEVQETALIVHKVMVPYGINGKIKSIKDGDFTVLDKIATIEDEDGKESEVQMLQYWPVRNARPFKTKIYPEKPLITGTRVIDTFFPLAKGGAANIPGAFGTGKSVTQHMLAKWSDADIVIYVGCGERGNEMTEALEKFPQLTDPHSGRPLMERTILIANTSNMPIAAREASVYTGITLAEYYRDMGYDVALMADSTSRWAEAMREISGRLEEMPGEEGFPAYLASRIASFYERAGNIKALSSEDRTGSITVVGAISPPGGDFSEPVSQASFQVTKVFWALDKSLAYARHYPAFNWLTSYSQYDDVSDNYYKKEISQDFPELRRKAMQILQKEAELQEIIKIVGADSLSNIERVLLDTARTIREDFLQQNAFDEVDTYTSLKKQYYMLKAIMTFHQEAENMVRGNEDLNIEQVFDNPIKEDISNMKMVPEDQIERIRQILEMIPEALKHQHVNEDSEKVDMHRTIANLNKADELQM